MGDSSPSGYRDLVTGALSGFAALATAVAGVVRVLHETGYLGSRTVASPAAIASASTLAQPGQAIASVASNPSVPAQPSITGANRAGAPPYQQAAITPANIAPKIAPPPGSPSQQRAQSERRMVALSGAWTDFGPGYCHAIKQTGSRFEIVNFAPITNTFISVGHGTVNGRTVHLEMNDLHPAAATAELYLSNDGQKLMGTLRRQDGEHPLVWPRKGSPCS